jgi:hypothetical protein
MSVTGSVDGSCCGPCRSLFVASRLPWASPLRVLRQWSASPVNAFTLWKPDAVQR